MVSAKIVKMQLNRIKKECDFALLYEDMKGQFPISELKSYEHFLSYLKNPDYYILKWEDFGYILILDVFDYIWVDLKKELFLKLKKLMKKFQIQ